MFHANRRAPREPVPPSQLHQRSQASHRHVMTPPRANTHHKCTKPESPSVQMSSPNQRYRICKNLFSPPMAMFGMSTPTKDNDENVEAVHLSHSNYSTTKVTSKATMATPEQKVVNRSGRNEFCGLTAEITRELSGHRRFRKTPRPKNSGIMTSMEATPHYDRKNLDDIFRVPLTEVKDFSNNLPTISLSNSTDIMSPGSSPSSQHQAVTSIKKKRSVTTPIRIRRKNLTVSFLSAKKLKKCLTPPREGFGSHLKERMKGSQFGFHDGDYNGSQDGTETNSPSSPNSFSMALPGAENYKIMSTELEPSDFQCELPSKKEFLVHAKICSLVDSYTATHRTFNFAMLAGLTRTTLENEYARSTKERHMIAGSCHRDVVKQILDCSQDLVVEGFFREYTGEGSNSNCGLTSGSGSQASISGAQGMGLGKDDRVEAIIFSSETLRQLIVCYRGSTANQAKPLKVSIFAKEASSLLHDDQQVRTLSTVRDAYFGTSIEEAVFALLSNLASRKPFFDVVMTGHSFGATLATIGATRYATKYPMMRVSCHVFGCPRIGGEDWRQLVHSVPNLKIFRAENAGDQFVLLPNGNEWVHVGHAICFMEGISENGSSSNAVRFAAHRFDRDRTSSNMFDLIKCSKVNLPVNLPSVQVISHQGKLDHEMKAYLNKLTVSNEKWFTDFSGMEGNGVISFADNERRLLA